MNDDLYPVTIVVDRYNGTYSGSQWLAFHRYHYVLPEGHDVGDIECDNFWRSYNDGAFPGLHIGRGNTPSDAYEDLKKQVW